MSQLDLEAIRARRAEAIERGLEAGYRVRSRNFYGGNTEERIRTAIEEAFRVLDIDALIAEVERLAEIEGKLRRLYLQAVVRFKDE
jgi:hypothetical protein